MAVPSFIFGADTGLTQDQLSQRRKLLEAMQLRQMGSAPRNVGEGLAAVGNAIAYRVGMNQLAKGETAARERRDAIMAPLFSTPSSSPSLVDPNASASAAIPDSEVAGEIAATDPTPTSFSGNQQEFIDAILPAAIEEGKRTGVDPRIIVAQAAQETGWGKSAPGNNLFGIKSHGQSGGNSLMTTEYVDGQPVRVRDSFRAYENPGDSVRGYGDFILQNPRYEKFRTAQGLDEQLAALQASGYATDPNYSRSVGAIARGIKLPNEVASLDPSAGMPSAAAAIEAQAPGAGYIDPMVSAPNYDPASAGAPVAQAPTMGDAVSNGRQQVVAALSGMPRQPQQYSPAVNTVGNALAARNGQNTAVPPLPAPQEVAPAPTVAGTPVQASPQAQPQQVAQTGTDYFPPAPQPPSAGPSLQQLYQAATSPDVTEQDRALINMMIERKMQEADPVRRLQLEKGQLEIDALRNPRPKYDFMTLPDGTVLRTDSRGGSPQKVFESAPKPTTNQQDYQYYRDFEMQNGRTPLGPLEWEQAQRKAGAATTNVTVGEGDKFYENLDKKNAETFAAMSDTGIQARAKLGQIDRLEGLMANAPQGAIGALKQAAGEWGIPTEGLSDIQAASALLEKMVPEQRQPGSGTMSDADIKMFRNSLPRIINQPGGNQLIFQTLRGIAQYEQQMGEIADRVANREITPAEGRRQIQTLPNPLSEFKVPQGATPNEGFIDRPDLGPGVRVRPIQ